MCDDLDELYNDANEVRMLRVENDRLRVALERAIKYIDWSSEHAGADELIKELRDELEK